MSYRAFHRTWWAENPAYPNGLEPCPGKKHTIKRHVPTEDDARALCKEWNSEHPKGRYSDKAEFEEE